MCFLNFFFLLIFKQLELNKRQHEGEEPHPLLQQGSADGHSLLQVLDLPLVLRVGVDLDLALVGVKQLQLLLKLHPQNLVLCFLGLVQSQLRSIKKNKNKKRDLYLELW